MKHKNKSRK